MGAEIWENFESFASNSGARTHPPPAQLPHTAALSLVIRVLFFARCFRNVTCFRSTCLDLNLKGFSVSPFPNDEIGSNSNVLIQLTPTQVTFLKRVSQ